MINRLMFRPNLVDCILEERVAPAIANLATVILTTTGLTLIEGFPGANSSGAGSVGSNSGATSASSVSGVAMPTSFYVTGVNGISSLKPGNITGVPSLAGGTVAAGGVGLSIQVGSGADTGDSPTNGGATNNVVGRATVADPTANPTVISIGTVSSASSGPVLPPGQSYRDTAPVPAASSLNTVPQSATAGPGMSTDPYAPNPQAGAPTLGPFNMNRMGGMTNPIPGSLVPVSPMMPGNN
jgi:hypothetical protein